MRKEATFTVRKGATFSFVGEDDDGVEDLLDAEPGTVRPIHQQLFEIEDDETWAHGSDPVGTLYGFVVVAGGRNAVCHLVFSIGEDTLVATGVLPTGSSSVGDGWIAVTGGTEGLFRASGACQVSTRNPKRWDIFI